MRSYPMINRALPNRFSSVVGITLSVLMLLALYGCPDTQQFPDEPRIEFESFSRDTIAQGDSVFIQLRFEDGNGDIGQEDQSLVPTCNPDLCDLESDSSCRFDPAFSLFLIDSRDSCLSPAAYRLPHIAIVGANDDVSGTINLAISPICCKFVVPIPCQQSTTPILDELKYYVQIRDVAGNFSNIVETPTLYVQCDQQP